MIRTNVVSCLSSGLTKNNKMMSIFVLFSNPGFFFFFGREGGGGGGWRADLPQNLISVIYSVCFSCLSVITLIFEGK